MKRYLEPSLKQQIVRILEDLITDVEKKLEDGGEIEFKSIITTNLVLRPVGSLGGGAEGQGQGLDRMFAMCETFEGGQGTAEINVGPEGLELDVLCYHPQEANKEKLFEKICYLLKGRDRNC